MSQSLVQARSKHKERSANGSDAALQQELVLRPGTDLRDALSVLRKHAVRGKQCKTRFNPSFTISFR